MKFTKLFMAAFAAMAIFASCSKDSESSTEEVQNPPAASARLTINFKGTEGAGRSRALDADTHGQTLNNATLFIMNANNGLVVDPIYVPAADINATPAKEYAVTTSASYVIVVANTGDLTGLGALFNGVATLADLQSKVVKLSDLTNTANMWMYGKSSTLSFTGTASDGTSKLAQTSVNLSIIPARIDVKVENNMTNYGDPNTVTLEGVSILYSAAYTHLIPSTTYIPTPSFIAGMTGTPKYYLSGMTGWVSELTAQNEVYSALNKTWATPASADFAESFYALPGNGALSKNTIIAVYGDVAGTKRYFPVHFSDDDVFGQELANGKHYTITIQLNGNALISGEPDPENEVIGAYIEVSVTAGTWDVIPEVTKPMD